MKSATLTLLISALLLPAVTTASSSKVPSDVTRKLEQAAATSHPGDTAKQRKLVEAQKKAYHTIKNYQSDHVPATVVTTITHNIQLQYPHDYQTQLFFLNQQVNAYRRMGLASTRLLPTRIVECEELQWRLSVKGQPATYRGSITPGTADVIYVEVRDRRKLIGQNFGFPNPGGAWEVMVWGDYNIFNKHDETFYCEKY